MSAPTNNMNGPIVREAADEAADHRASIRRIQDQEYSNWPNEAGVSIHPIPHPPTSCPFAPGMNPSLTTTKFENLEEHRGPVELDIQGSFPPWTAGTLFRTGPGTNQIEGTPCGPDGVFHISHWFDGLAHTHRFDIVAPQKEGHNKIKIMYSSRRQSDKWVEFVKKNGPRNVITFAQKADPCVGLFSKLMSTWRSAAFGISTETARFENVGVTVQLDVPGLPSQAGHRSAPTVWLGTDAHFLCEVDRDTLEPLGIARQKQLHSSLDGPCSCAHVQRCPRTGDYFNVNIKPGAAATYRIFRVCAATGKTDILATISRFDLPMVYFHSFFLSENFVVLCLPSSHLKAYGLGVLWEKNMLDAIVPFDKENKCKWFVVDRVHGRGVVAEFETDAAFFFHTVNCFEEPIAAGVAEKKNNHSHTEGAAVNIICDVVEYPNMDIAHALYYDALLNRQGHDRSKSKKDPANTLPRLARWKFTVALPVPEPTTAKTEQGPETQSPVSSSWIWSSYRPFSWLGMQATSSTTSSSSSSPRGAQPLPRRAAFAKQGGLNAEKIFTILAPHIGELPTINPAYHTRSHRYVYSLAMSGRSTLTDSIVKTDTVTRQVLQWNNSHGHTPGEAIFVARPGATMEDDGMLLSVVLDGISSKSYLLCLDARTMVEAGRAEMAFAVGLGFHGIHTTEM